MSKARFPENVMPRQSRPQGSTVKIGMVGAGLMGRLLAFLLAESGYEITIFEQDDQIGARSCGYVGAGMLAPVSELEQSEPLVSFLGMESLAIWPKLLTRLESPVFFNQQGTLVVAHHLDLPDLQRFSRMLQSKISSMTAHYASFPEGITAENFAFTQLKRSGLRTLEPQLETHFQEGLLIPGEGQIDNRQLLSALADALNQFNQVTWRGGTEVQAIMPHFIDDGYTAWQFDWVIDCRGIGIGPDWSGVRGVRGEILQVHAPEVNISRPIRLMHPRHPIYIVPRENNRYLIGATSIESEDFRPITVQSAMELLSAAFAVHPGFAEATVLESRTHCRPALADNLPKIRCSEGLLRINGLYRHGFMISPKIATLVCQYLETGQVPTPYESLFEEEPLMRSFKQKKVNYALAH